MNGAPAPTMPGTITGMPAGVFPGASPALPTGLPAHPGNMPGGMPLPQPQTPPNGQPGPNPSPYIFEDQGNGTALIRLTGQNGAPGPVVKVVSMPKPKQPMPH
jgi:hypothetical protein